MIGCRFHSTGNCFSGDACLYSHAEADIKKTMERSKQYAPAAAAKADAPAKPKKEKKAKAKAPGGVAVATAVLSGVIQGADSASAGVTACGPPNAKTQSNSSSFMKFVKKGLRLFSGAVAVTNNLQCPSLEMPSHLGNPDLISYGATACGPHTDVVNNTDLISYGATACGPHTNVINSTDLITHGATACGPRAHGCSAFKGKLRKKQQSKNVSFDDKVITLGISMTAGRDALFLQSKRSQIKEFLDRLLRNSCSRLKALCYSTAEVARSVRASR
jgi:hypothetical protein